jgi:MFS transporter, YNFM family, putative membrane transport protein
MNAPIALLSLAAFLAAATTRACDALLPNIALAFDVPIAAAAIAVTAFTFAYGFFQLLYGPVGVRIGPYRTVAIATGLASLGAAACALAPTLAALGFARAFSGLTAAAIIPMSMAHIGETVAYEERQAVIARFLMGQIGGLVFGQAFAGLFAELFTWRQLFWVLMVGFLAIALALFHMLRRVPRKASGETLPNPIVQYLRVLQVPWARVVLLTVFVEGFLCFGAFPYTSAHLALNFGLSDLAIGLTMGSFGLGGLAYALGVRRLLALLGEPGLALVGGALLLLGFAVVALAPVWQAVAPAAIALGLGFYMFHNTLQTNATQMAPFDRSAAIALFAFCLFVSQALGASLFGQIAELTGYRPIFMTAGLGLLLLALLFRRLRLAHVPAG